MADPQEAAVSQSSGVDHGVPIRWRLFDSVDVPGKRSFFRYSVIQLDQDVASSFRDFSAGHNCCSYNGERLVGTHPYGASLDGTAIGAECKSARSNVLKCAGMESIIESQFATGARMIDSIQPSSPTKPAIV